MRRRRDIKVAHLLVSRGADANAVNHDGMTALHGAAIMGATKLVELLLANGADISTRDSNGMTPLEYAIGEGHPAIVNLLRRYSG